MKRRMKRSLLLTLALVLVLLLIPFSNITAADTNEGSDDKLGDQAQKTIVTFGIKIDGKSVKAGSPENITVNLPEEIKNFQVELVNKDTKKVYTSSEWRGKEGFPISQVFEEVPFGTYVVNFTLPESLFEKYELQDFAFPEKATFKNGMELVVDNSIGNLTIPLAEKVEEESESNLGLNLTIKTLAGKSLDVPGATIKAVNKETNKEYIFTTVLDRSNHQRVPHGTYEVSLIGLPENSEVLAGRTYTLPESKVIEVVGISDYNGLALIETRTPAKPEKIKLIFNPNEGEWADGLTEDKTLLVDKGTVIEIPEAPVREGHEFTYWEGSEYQPGDKYTAVEDHVFVAQWKKTADVTPETTKPSEVAEPLETTDPSEVTEPLETTEPSAATEQAATTESSTKTEKATQEKVAKTGAGSSLLILGLAGVTTATTLVVLKKGKYEE